MNKILIAYWSGTGNTEQMANLIAEGAKSAGAAADVRPVSELKPSDVEVYEGIAFGCPAMGDEVLEETEFEPFYDEAEGKLGGKNVALFGSYGWGDGAWMRSWQDRVQAAGAKLFEEGLTVLSAPEGDAAGQCREFGKRFAGLS